MSAPTKDDGPILVGPRELDPRCIPTAILLGLLVPGTAAERGELQRRYDQAVGDGRSITATLRQAIGWGPKAATAERRATALVGAPDKRAPTPPDAPKVSAAHRTEKPKAPPDWSKLTTLERVDLYHRDRAAFDASRAAFHASGGYRR